MILFWAKNFVMGFTLDCGNDVDMYLLVILSDSRVDNWLFMSSPWPTLTLTALYLLICYTGPKLMENRKPWDLKAFIVIYNFCLVLLSAYMFIEVSEFFY